MGDVLPFQRGRARRHKAGSFPSPRIAVHHVADDVPIVATSEDGNVLLITDVQPDGSVTGLYLTVAQARDLATQLIREANGLDDRDEGA